jgi:hypothetical protein
MKITEIVKRKTEVEQTSKPQINFSQKKMSFQVILKAYQ